MRLKKNQLKREKRRSKSTDLIHDSSYKIVITPSKENEKNYEAQLLINLILKN
jgi:hypothetical protein